jgi:hypothetical protein
VLALLLAALVTGTVSDAGGAPLPGATVYVRQGDAFAVTDAQGRFTLGANAGAVLVATFPGLKAAEATVADPAVPLRLVLGVPAQTETVTVSARAERGPADAPQRISRLQVLRMPGAAADPLRAVQMLPGVSKADDGAGLFVRGGDVSETATYLDRALVPHPYRAESASGGLFGTVPNFLVSGLSLSTGGFPARYGGALSAVLEMEALGAPTVPAFQATVGLGGASALVSRPLGRRFAIRASGNQGATRLLFAVNPPEQPFSRYPEHTDLSLTLYGDLGGAGRLRAFLIGDREAVGVQIEAEAFRGELDSQRRHGMAALAWDRVFASRWLVALTGSASTHEKSLDVGVTRLDTTERGGRGRLDVSGTLAGGTLRLGAEVDGERIHREGVTSVRGRDLLGTSGLRTWDQRHRATRSGAYLEMERPLGRLTVNAGLRADHFAPFDRTRLDPRLSATWSLGGSRRLRLATGLYHQAPDPAYLDAADGAPGLGLMRARHVVFGFEHGRADGPLHVRIEAYDKAYTGLPVEETPGRFGDAGHGFARGVDAVLMLRTARLEGSLAYSALHARRRSTPFEERGRGTPPPEPAPPGFAVPHTLQGSARAALPYAFSLGGGLRLAAGAPHTPIVGGRTEASGLVPVYGPPGSERLPSYQRADLALSRVTALAGGTLVLFFGMSNALDHANVFDYSYSPDYTDRRPVRSNWGRSVYVGGSYIR